MSNEHVEVLRDLSEVCRAAIKAGDWVVDGACDPDAALRRADAAIAALSAPQPPAEAQPVAWADEDMARHWIDRYAAGIDAEPQLDLILDCVAPPPSAPVGVAADILRIVDTAIDVCNDRDRPAMAEDLEAVRLYVEQASAALAHQPATVTQLERSAVSNASAPVGVEGFDEWFYEYTENDYTVEMLALAAWKQALAQQPAADFDTWQRNPYTKVLMKSIDEDYVPKHGQQPAAVDGAMVDRVTDAVVAWGSLPGDPPAEPEQVAELRGVISAAFAAHALAAQQGGCSDD